jgi:hypothetical protein
VEGAEIVIVAWKVLRFLLVYARLNGVFVFVLLDFFKEGLTFFRDLHSQPRTQTKKRRQG